VPLRVLADYLQQHPDSILRGKPASMRPSRNASAAMTPRSHPLTAFTLVALLALGACSSSPPPTRLHTLMPAEPTPRDTAAAARGPVFVALEPIRLPSQVDQPQWLVRLPDETLASLEQERWASPLGDELHQALLEQLSARFGVVEGRSVAPRAAAPLRVALELRRFDSLPGREARIEGAWTVAGRPAAASSSRPAPGGAASSRRRIVARWRSSPARSVQPVAVPPAAARLSGSRVANRDRWSPRPARDAPARSETARPSRDDRAGCCRSSDQPARAPAERWGEPRSGS
jgi:uncharacterized lipoprotein YmbA